MIPSSCYRLTPTYRPAGFFSTTSFLTSWPGCQPSTHQAFCCCLPLPHFCWVYLYFLQDFPHVLQFAVRPSLSILFKLECPSPITKLPTSALVFPIKPSPHFLIFSLFVSHNYKGKPQRTKRFCLIHCCLPSACD